MDLASEETHCKMHALIKNYNYMMGEGGCTLTIIDVADALQANYAFISGGKSRRSFPIITFPECPTAASFTDEQYKNVVTYLASIPTLREADLGFVIIVDRRQDKWGSVKTLLLRISGHFPALVQKVYLLRPSSFLQKTFVDMGFKFLKDDFKFKILMLNSIEELHDHIDKDQLTPDLNGTLQYNHSEWIQHRAALEKFSANTSQIAEALRQLCSRLGETEFPNDVTQTETLIQDHEVARREVKEDLESTIKHGEVLLGCFKTVKTDEGLEVQVVTSDLPICRIAHVTAVERLLVQLDETVNNFEIFWEHHKLKLIQCLELRKFEEEFKLLQFVGERHLVTLGNMAAVCDSLQRVDALLTELQQFEAISKDDIGRAEQLRFRGETFIDENHYAVDCIRPKCSELLRICDQYKDSLRDRHLLLQTSKDLHDKIDKANKWCTRGVDLLASQPIEKCSTDAGAESALEEIDAFLYTANDFRLDNPQEFRSTYDNVITPDMLEVIQQVLLRLDDVRSMCDKRRSSLRHLFKKPQRPVQTVRPEPVLKAKVIGSPEAKPAFIEESDSKRFKRPSLKGRGKGLQRSQSKSTFYNLESPESEIIGTDLDVVEQKRRHVMQELIETERIYVDELRGVLQGYAWQMDRDEVQYMIPDKLRGKKELLFGNMDQIYNFHAKIFLKELEDCQETPALVGRCFVNRKEEFKMYSLYCQNKLASEELRRKVGDQNTFFKECQKKLDHKLPLGAYLLKPVQRITKYQLLLKEMLKFADSDDGCEELKDALDTMLSVVKHVNDIMHQISIKGFEGDLTAQGSLLMQGPFSVWTEHKKLRDLRFKPMCRHIFLYEKSILFCKKKEDPQNAEKASYIFKNYLQTYQIGLTETVKGDKKKFELWLHGRAEVYIIQAPSVEVKDIWVTEIKKVLFEQFDLIRETTKKKKVPTATLR